MLYFLFHFEFGVGPVIQYSQDAVDLPFPYILHIVQHADASQIEVTSL